MLSSAEKQARIEKAQSYAEGSRNQKITAPLLEIIQEQTDQLAKLDERHHWLSDAKSRAVAERDTYEEQARHNAEKLNQLETAIHQIAQEHDEGAMQGTSTERLNWMQSQLRMYDDCKNHTQWARAHIANLETQLAQADTDSQAEELAALRAELDEKDTRWQRDMLEAGERFKQMMDSNDQRREVLHRRIQELETQLAQASAPYETRTTRNPHTDKGGKLPYGYHRTHSGTEVQPGEAGIVKRVFQRWDAGHSARQIARDLNTDHIPTPRQGSKGWTHQAVNIILGNAQIYLGNDEHYPAILNTASPRQDSEILDTLRDMGTDLLI